MGWEVREEEPPNKDVVASDLAEALVKLSGKLHSADDAQETPCDQDEKAGDITGAENTNGKPPLRVTAPSDTDVSNSKHSPAGGAGSARNRSRSSTILYDPESHGDSSALPAVMVEDTTMDAMDDDGGDADGAAASTLEGIPLEGKTIIAHTSRPPVELMESA